MRLIYDGSPLHHNGLEIGTQCRLDRKLPRLRYLYQGCQRAENTIQASLQQRLDAYLVGSPRIAHPIQCFVFARQTGCRRSRLEERPIPSLQLRAPSAQFLLQLHRLRSRLGSPLLHSRPLPLQVEYVISVTCQLALQVLNSRPYLVHSLGLLPLLDTQGPEFGNDLGLSDLQLLRPLLRHGSLASQTGCHRADF
jgi:hypothetical protein